MDEGVPHLLVGARPTAPGKDRDGGPLQVLPVGKSANQAVVAAPLGARVSMVGAVGGDANGAMRLESLRNAGVDASRVQVSSSPPVRP